MYFVFSLLKEFTVCIARVATHKKINNISGKQKIVNS